jgi:hypothetical protein
VKKLAIATVGVALASAAWGVPPFCCACLEDAPAGQTAQIGTNGSIALFCAAAPDGNTSALGERCAGLGDGPTVLVCTLFSSNATCRQELGEAGIACPDTGVPAADPLNLATLAVVLGTAGGLILRRRPRRDV